MSVDGNDKERNQLIALKPILMKMKGSFTNIVFVYVAHYIIYKLSVYHNPDDLISFSSDIKCLTKLRAELCRLPRKKNNSGMIELYTKADMVAGITMSDGRKLSIPSPNLADDVMMSFDRPDLVRPVQSNAMPPSLNLPRFR